MSQSVAIPSLEIKFLKEKSRNNISAYYQNA